MTREPYTMASCAQLPPKDRSAARRGEVSCLAEGPRLLGWGLETRPPRHCLIGVVSGVQGNDGMPRQLNAIPSPLQSHNAAGHQSLETAAGDGF